MQTKRLVTELARNRLCVWACLFPRGDKPKFILRVGFVLGGILGSPWEMDLDIHEIARYLSGPLLLSSGTLKLYKLLTSDLILPFIKLD